MRLTIYTDYALRLLMYLALKDGAVATISEVASSYGISRNHLMKVAYELGAAGYIETIRGRGAAGEAGGIAPSRRHCAPNRTGHGAGDVL
jgi:Rrf2 family protein